MAGAVVAAGLERAPMRASIGVERIIFTVKLLLVERRLKTSVVMLVGTLAGPWVNIGVVSFLGADASADVEDICWGIGTIEDANETELESEFGLEKLIPFDVVS